MDVRVCVGGDQDAADEGRGEADGGRLHVEQAVAGEREHHQGGDHVHDTHHEARRRTGRTDNIELTRALGERRRSAARYR